MQFKMKPPNLRVDPAARIQSSIAGRIKLRNTPPRVQRFVMPRLRIEHYAGFWFLNVFTHLAISEV